MKSSRQDRKLFRDYAVAIEAPKDGALPKVLASGSGEIAKSIIALAEESGVPIHKDANLAEMLSEVKTGDIISPETCAIVAEVLCFLYQADSEYLADNSGS